MSQTLFDKIWSQHIVSAFDEGPDVLYIDRHFIHEVTSPQAFAGLEAKGLKVRRPDLVTATADHNVPTKDQHLPIREKLSALQVEQLHINCEKHGIPYYGLGHKRQGIVHVIGPEQGWTQPGMTIVCGDSHTSTHGAFGAIAFGIGTSEVEMVLASQCLLQSKPRQMRLYFDGTLPEGVSAKDLALYTISQLGTDGGTGYFIEYAGPAIEALSVEGRMTLCNMSIEMGARGGLIAPDAKTLDYVKGRPEAPQGEAWEVAASHWQTLFTDAEATFDAEHRFDISDLGPMITYGTHPGMAASVHAQVPAPQSTREEEALAYMALTPGQTLSETAIQHVFIGSCTNSRIEDLREAADVVEGQRVAEGVTAWVVPGSQAVAKQAIAEGLDTRFITAGFDFREPGCSACLAMNEDKVPAGHYCVSTSNRNFVGRQGPGARTLLASPASAAAAAIAGRIADHRNIKTTAHVAC